MRPGLAIERVRQDRAGCNEQHDDADHVERIAAERAAQQVAQPAVMSEVGGIERCGAAQARFLTLMSAGATAGSGIGNRSTLDASSTARAVSQSTGRRTMTLVPAPSWLRIVELAAMQLDQALHDRQAEAGAVMGAVVGGAHLEERIADMAQIVLADADAGVLDGEESHARRRARR